METATNPNSFSQSVWIQAHWYKRFSEEPNNRVIIKGCSHCSKNSPEEVFINLLDITKEPVFNKSNELIGLWENKGNVSRPNGKRFYETFNTRTNKFNVWIYKSLVK